MTPLEWLHRKPVPRRNLFAAMRYCATLVVMDDHIWRIDANGQEQKRDTGPETDGRGVPVSDA